MLSLGIGLFCFEKMYFKSIRIRFRYLLFVVSLGFQSFFERQSCVFLGSCFQWLGSGCESREMVEEVNWERFFGGFFFWNNVLGVQKVEEGMFGLILDWGQDGVNFFFYNCRFLFQCMFRYFNQLMLVVYYYFKFKCFLFLNVNWGKRREVVLLKRFIKYIKKIILFNRFFIFYLKGY